eukprot:SAG22_NODE_2922_length_2101_cov_1.501499_4_plen_112_part_01
MDVTRRRRPQLRTQHDLNSGPVCPGDKTNSMLLYPAQGRPNEKYTHDKATGKLHGGSRCLVAGPPSTPSPPGPPPPPRPPPPPPPPPGVTRTISVRGEQRGWPGGTQAAVRD